jgi:DNA primase
VLLATLANHPALVADFEGDLEAMFLVGEGHDSLRHALLADRIEGEARAVLERLLALSHVSTAPPVRRGAESGLARLCLAEGFAKLHARRAARAEIAEAMADMDGMVDEGLTWRLAQVAAARHRAEAPRMAEGAEGGEDTAALSRHLQEMLDGQIWIKRRN